MAKALHFLAKYFICHCSLQCPFSHNNISAFVRNTASTNCPPALTFVLGLTSKSRLTEASNAVGKHCRTHLEVLRFSASVLAAETEMRVTMVMTRTQF